MKNIAIVCGGNSGEYQVSMNSGRSVKKFLDSSRYSTYLVEIKQNNWAYISDDDKRIPIDKSDFSLIIDNEKIVFDAVFNAIHGTPGENGVLQGYLDLLNIPYTSCGIDTSALTFNKYLCNNFIRSLGVKTANSLSFKKNESIDKESVIELLGLPLFVKPSRSGSSVGVSKVKNSNDFDVAIEKAFQEDERIMIEEELKGRELTCGVFQKGKEMIIFPLTEIVSYNEFFDYEAKYLGKSEEITPALIDEGLDIQIKNLSSYLYHKLDCKGVVRFDYIVVEEEIYFLEVNTVPGMTEASIIPQQAAAFGMDKKQLFTLMVDVLFLNGE